MYDANYLLVLPIVSIIVYICSVEKSFIVHISKQQREILSYAKPFNEKMH